MKIRFGFFTALVILALISMTGIGAAEQDTGNPAVSDEHFIVRPSDDLNVPAPLPDDGNWTGTMTDDNQEGNCDGTFGAGSPFYGLKLAFEDLDESFTFNETERIEKQIRHADNRLSDVQCELARNRTTSLDRILERYQEKINQTEDSLKPLQSNGTGLLHAREMIQKHRGILQNLSEQNPDNKGLAKAFNNSQNLQYRFDEKIRMRFNQSAMGNTTSAEQPVPPDSMGKNTGNGNDKTPPGRQNQQDSGNANGGRDLQNDKNNQKQDDGNNRNDPDKQQDRGNNRNN